MSMYVCVVCVYILLGGIHTSLLKMYYAKKKLFTQYHVDGEYNIIIRVYARTYISIYVMYIRTYTYLVFYAMSRRSVPSIHKLYKSFYRCHFLSH